MTGIVVEGEFGGEPQRSGSVGGSGGLEGRVSQLEGRMTTVEAGIKSAADLAQVAAANAATAADNTRELLAIANATKGAIGFAKKHGPKIVSFGCGVMTILGFGNPELWKYISHFFAP